MNAAETYAVHINRQSLDDAAFNALVAKTKDLLESYGFTVHLLSKYAPAKVDRDYGVIKTHGYRINEYATFNNVTTALSGSSAWTKLVAKSEIEPGFYVQSHYGNIQDADAAKICKLLQLKAFKMLPAEMMDVDVFAMPIKACEKLQADDGWINLAEYIDKVADVNVAELCYDVWVAETLKGVIGSMDTASKHTLQIFDKILPLRALFSELRSIMLDNEIMLSGYDPDTLRVMISLKPHDYVIAGNNIRNMIQRYVIEVFKKFPLLPTHDIFCYSYMNADVNLIAEYMEYITYFANTYPERMNHTPFDVNSIMSKFPKLPVVKVIPVTDIEDELVAEALEEIEEEVVDR
jgi:hypothetical protein